MSPHDEYTTLLDAALAYAEQGIPVFPIKPNEKQPLVKDWQEIATTNPDQIRTWWSRVLDANIGRPTGARSGCFVLDADIKNGGPTTLAQLEQQYGLLPITQHARTASGGEHLYFRHPGEHVKNSVQQIGPGLDIRGDGGLVVLPPSRIFDHQYEWLKFDVPLAAAPQWFWEKVVASSRIGADPLEIAALLDGVPEGQRDVMLFRWASKLRGDGLPMEITEAIIVLAAQKCNPPFSEEVARKKVRRVYETYQRNYLLTDVGNMERLVDRHRGDLRFCPAIGWLVYDGMRWKRDELGTVVVLARENTRAMLQEAARLPNDERNMLISYAQRSERRERIVATVELAKSDPAFAVAAADLDKQLMLLNCRNGTLNLQTGELRAHNYRDLITKVVGTSYEPDATAPTWDKFLERVLPNPEVRAFVQRAVGYSLTGLTDEQVMFFLYGTGANGKSTFVQVVLELMGDYAQPSPPDLIMLDKHDTHPTAIADLAGTRFTSTIEAEEGKRMAEAQVKWMTGGDKMKGRFLYRDYFDFQPQFKLWLVANHKPVVVGRDHGIWRRILLVPFTEVISEDERDPKLLSKLLAEAPGILRWAVEGCVEWQRQGLNPPEQVKAATREYQSDMDVLGHFLEECVEPCDGCKVSASEMFKAYEGWARDNGIKRPLTQIKLTNELKDLGYEGRRLTGNKLHWLNIRLTEAGMECLNSAFYGMRVALN